MAHAIASYVPRLVFDRLAAGQGFDGPEWSRVPAAVLLGDICDSTAIMERCSMAGPDGLETLTWNLNAYVGDLVATVHAHGGDVLFIAGDAFLCYWPASDHGDRQAVAQAAATALALQDLLDGRAAGAGLDFHMRIGVGTGELVIAFVGGVSGRWQLITAGAAFAQAVRAERSAPAGRVHLSDEAAALLARDAVLGAGEAGDSAHGVRLDALRIEAELTPADEHETAADLETAIRPFAPPAVVDRLLLDDADWLAEARQVTVLMSDLAAAGDDGQLDDAALSRVHAGVRAFQQAVQRFDGTVKIDVDDKGILLLGVFGLPPLAHENNAERAIECAWAAQDALERLGISSASGIATGRAICGSFGNERRREYMLRGDVINLAARLMTIGDGGPVCDEATRRAVGARMRFEDLGAHRLRGRSGPVPCHRPAGRALGLPHRTLFGRHGERAALRQLLVALHDLREAGMALLEADAGQGKSTLLADISTEAERIHVRVLSGSGDAIERATPYRAWRPVLARLLGLSEGEPARAARPALERCLARVPHLQRFAPLLDAVLPLGLAETPLTAGMGGEVRAENLRRLLAGLIEAEAREAPLALIIDDAHWLDSSSLQLLLALVASDAPLLIVVATRPPLAQASAEQQQLVRAAGRHHLRLEGVGAHDTAALLARQLAVDEVPEHLAREVHDRSGGNPFFAEELVRTLRAEGALKVVDGRCELDAVSLQALPPTVEGAILARLDRLPAEQQLCLKVAAVLGPAFTLRALRDTLPVESQRRHVAEHLTALAAHGLIWLEAAHPESSYRFRHIITHEVTYGLMPQRQRQPLHQAVAHWYEHRHRADLDPHSALLAYHWEAAGEPLRALPYLARAADLALRNGVFREAAELYQRALATAALPQAGVAPVERALWTRGLGMAHYFMGDLDASRAHLERAVSALDRPIPGSGTRTVVHLLGNLARQVAHRLAPQHFLGRARSQRAAYDAAVDCYKALSQIYYLAGEAAPDLSYVTLRGLNVGELAGASTALACVTSNMGVMAGLVGLRGAGQRYAERAIAMAEDQELFAASAYVWHIHALQRAQNGDWPGAREASDLALARIRELADFNLEAEAWVVRSTVELCAGAFRDAEDAWSRARQLAERRGNPQILCWTLLDEVETRVAGSDLAGAERALDRALAIETSDKDGYSTIEKLRATAIVRLHQGRLQEAVEAADRVTALVTRQPPTGYHWVDFLASATEVYLRVLEQPDAALPAPRQDIHRRAARAVRSLGKLARVFGNVRVRVVWLGGLLQRLAGRTGPAVRQLRRAVQMGDDLFMPYEAAMARCELAVLLPAAEARAALDRALPVLEQLGALQQARHAIGEQ